MKSQMDVVTPALLISKEQLERNALKMIGICAERGLVLRPNVKTHKSIVIARAQFTGKLSLVDGDESVGGILRVCTSTLLESKHFLENSEVGDVLYAVPLAGAAKIAQASKINGPRFAVLVDNVEHVDALAQTGQPWRVWLKVDCGYGRAGRRPDLIGVVADRVRQNAPLLQLIGFYTHAGHSYRVGSDEALAELSAVQGCSSCYDGGGGGGPGGTMISFGSTPTASRAADSSHYVRGSEIHPGNYIFYDRQQLQIGSCASRDEISVCVLATVIGVYPERGTALIDAGSRCLGKDTLEKPTHSTWAEILGYPELQLNSISQEVGIISGPGASLLQIGQQLKLLPNHSCLTATNFSTYHVVDSFNNINHAMCLLGTISPCERGFA